jgi:hypothetical protein
MYKQDEKNMFTTILRMKKKYVHIAENIDLKSRRDGLSSRQTAVKIKANQSIISNFISLHKFKTQKISSPL